MSSCATQTKIAKKDIDLIEEIPGPDKVMTLVIGKPAPYSGVFMPEDQFRYFKTIELENEMISKRVEKCDCNFVVWTLGGVLIGALLFSLVSGKQLNGNSVFSIMAWPLNSSHPNY